MAEEKSKYQLLEEKLSKKRENGWKLYGADKKPVINKISAEYLGYISRAKTERLNVKVAVEWAEKEGFKPAESFEALKPGDKVYFNYRGKNLLLAIIGTKGVDLGFNIVASHVDAPRLDLKPSPLVEDTEFAMLKTHYYGGIKKYQWVNIPLALAGVVVLKDGKIIEIHIGDKDDDPIFMIPDLLPHLAKSQAEKKIADAITGEQLMILVGSEPVNDDKIKEKVKLHVLEILYEQYGITEDDFLSAELEVVPAGKARELGLDRSMISGYGHDDRICGFANLYGLFALDNPERTAVAYLADKEEIGSVGATGMDSIYFYHALSKIATLINPGISEVKIRELLHISNALSTDVEAAINPLFKEVHEANNAAKFGYGAAFSKYTGARGKGGSNDADAEYVAKLRKLLEDANVPYQIAELGKVDEGGGGTVAYLLARYGIHTIDMGVALLSMHSPWEIASKVDLYAVCEACKHFLQKM